MKLFIANTLVKWACRLVGSEIYSFQKPAPTPRLYDRHDANTNHTNTVDFNKYKRENT